MASGNRLQGYQPIENYGAIGNLRTVSLVGLDGAIDWCCLPYLDSPAVFGAILDQDKGGTFRIGPVDDDYASTQRYFEHTNVLITEMRTASGCVEIVDCMPVEGDLNGCGYSMARAEILRFVRGIEGQIDLELLWQPRFDYGRADHEFRRLNGGVLARSQKNFLSLTGVPGAYDIEAQDRGPALRSRFAVGAGDEFCLVTRWGSNHSRAQLERCRSRINATVDAWRKWVHKPGTTGSRDWAGAAKEKIIRSELALKLMSQADSGALAAAATTSLPETLGGARNWDYRYAWIRDAAQVARAFYALGHTDELDYFIEWAEQASFLYGHQPQDLAIMYPLRPDTDLAEAELDHLQGYAGSAPVRIGNLASQQLQLDIYGELVGAVHERVRLEKRFDFDVGPFLQRLVDQACRRWQEPDSSIWEPRNGPDQFVYSKLMVWVALTRAVDLHHQGLIAGDIARWQDTAQAIKDWILSNGYSEQRQAFVQIAGKPHLDAAALLIPIQGLLPADDRRVQSTIDAILEELTVDDLVYRYRAPDGLPGEEGSFVLCTFWLVDALTLSGRLSEARRIFDRLLSRTNHLGLLSEQIDPSSGHFLGNFPQAYSHVGMINSALLLADAEGRTVPVGLGTQVSKPLSVV